MVASVIPKTTTAGDVLNRVAAEMGIEPVGDPIASADPFFIQMRYLLATAGEEISIQWPWNYQNREFLIPTPGQLETQPLPPVSPNPPVTSTDDSGRYALPEDFNFMIPQTGWDRVDDVPLFGPLSPQDWQYLLGRDLVTQTIYASFRINQGQFWIFPQPLVVPDPGDPAPLELRFEYQSKFWVRDKTNIIYFKETIDSSGDIILHDRTLVTRYLKVKALDARGYDATGAQDDYNQMFSFLTGKDKTAEVLNAGSQRNGLPYLDSWNSLPDTNYGTLWPG